MTVTDIVWKNRYVEKLAAKHNISTAQAEEVLFSSPVVRRIAKVVCSEKMCTLRWHRFTGDDT